MFTKFIVANRGAVASRVLRALNEMGIHSDALYSEADADAPYLAMASETYAIGPAPARESYLNQDLIIEILKKSHADGLHPGYGFLSENAGFAQRVIDAGSRFIGPSPKWIDAMGHKTRARELAAQHGMPMSKGSPVLPKEMAGEEILKIARDIGYPVLVKPAGGGGGIGMLPAKDEAQLLETVERSRSMASRGFGNAEVYLERLFERPRHVEFQILGDQHGNVAHLFERDCSTQRRNQKVIEEAPGPNIPRAKATEVAEHIAGIMRKIGYDNIGTVEMLLGADGSFNFLEMNTRLQVEHGVTEEVTGIDLVEWMIRVASGEPLPMTQAEINAGRRGHAIEIRINAEDPAGGKFLPSPGKITALRPADGYGTRFDGGYEAGDEISQYYDNLIGKLIVWGRDRTVAIARAIRALEETVVEGVATTIPADLAILRHPDFAAATHSTKWVEDVLDLSGIGAKPKAMVAEATDGEAPVTLVERTTTVEVNGKRFNVKMWVPDQPMVVATGNSKETKKPTRAAASAGGASGSGEVAVPMQGTIVKVLVEVGQDVAVGQAVVVLEAMKMENQITAEKAGKVKEIKVTVGSTVGAGDVVVVIE